MSSAEPNAETPTRLRPREWALFAAAMLVIAGFFAWRSHRRASGALFERTGAGAPVTSEAGSASASALATSTATDATTIEAERVLAATKPLIKRCFLEERKQRPDVRGNLEVTIKVDAGGKASSIVLGPSGVRSDAFDACVQKAFADKVSGSTLGNVDIAIDIGLR